MILRQYKLRSHDGEMICWLEDGRTKIGDLVTLKDSEDDACMWQVVEAYSATDAKNIKRGWKNNI